MINLRNRKGVDISSNNGKISIEKIKNSLQATEKTDNKIAKG